MCTIDIRKVEIYSNDSSSIYSSIDSLCGQSTNLTYGELICPGSKYGDLRPNEMPTYRVSSGDEADIDLSLSDTDSESDVPALRSGVLEYNLKEMVDSYM